MNVVYWVKRTIKEMQDNKEVQEKVLSGFLDKYLKDPELPKVEEEINNDTTKT